MGWECHLYDYTETRPGKFTPRLDHRSSSWTLTLWKLGLITSVREFCDGSQGIGGGATAVKL